MQRQGNRILEGYHTSTGLLILTILCVSFFMTPAGAVTVQLLHIGNGYSPGADLSNPLGIFYDPSSSECYVTDTGNGQVIVYDENGMPIYRFYHHVTVNGARRIGEPNGLVVDSEGRIYVIDSLVPYLDILDRNGRTIAAVEPPFDRCGEHVRFDGIAIGEDDRVYASISCGEERLITVIGFDFDLERIIPLRSRDLGPTCMTSLDIDPEGNFYVTDPCANLMVQVYDPEGNYLSGFGKHDSGYENFSHPSGISVMPDGEMWIVDSIRQVVSCFTGGGQFLSFVGGKGTQPGAFNYPSGIDTDGKDRLFVVERAGNRYQCFRIVHDETETAGK
jgi:DNA-binding beta-propeller fold protein YncE